MITRPDKIRRLLRNGGVRGTAGFFFKERFWNCMRRLRFIRSERPVYFLRSRFSPVPVALRAGSSDRRVFRQVLVNLEYDCFPRVADPRVIIDCGANVGYSTLFFLSAYPMAQLIAIEPDAGNFAMLRRNTEWASSRVTLRQAGLWSRCVGLKVRRGGYLDGREWAYQVAPCTTEEEAEVQGVDLATVIHESGFQRIDILKIDIERAERELFREGAQAWLDLVDNIAIELHDEECEAVFLQALAAYAYERTCSGELTVLYNVRRKAAGTPACLTEGLDLGPQGASNTTRPPRASVVIPTYNRPQLLSETITSILNQDVSPDDYELVVIDNNSPPETRNVVDSFRERRPRPRYVLETRQGLNHARNRGVKEATGEIIILVDDDVIAHPQWLRGMMDGFTPPGGERVAVLGGAVRPKFGVSCPRWMARLETPLTWGNTLAPLEHGEMPMGANIAFARWIFSEVGQFRPDLDRKGTSLFAGGESELLNRIRKAGYKVWFEPRAVVDHQLPASRLTFRFACRNAFDSARSRVIARLNYENADRIDRLVFLSSRLLLYAASLPVYGLAAGLMFPLLQFDSARKLSVKACRSAGYVWQLATMSAKADLWLKRARRLNTEA